MDGALSQEEINALLSQAGAGASQPSSTLTDEEKRLKQRDFIPM